MDLEQLKNTQLWDLYEQGRNYCNRINLFTDTDKNYEFYNGDQWRGVRISGIEPVQLNFIKAIVKYKVANINSNLYIAKFSSENFEKSKRKSYEQICKMLDRKVANIWEQDSLDIKIRNVSKDSAINDEGIMYVDYDDEKQIPINQILSKNDIFYGNENDSDIQSQPYIILKQRMSVIETQNLAISLGVPEEEARSILGDSMYFDEAGEQAKVEKDNMCTVLTKLYKENGQVYFEKATRYVELKKRTATGLKLYPVAHMTWEEKIGSARGEGEVRYLIPNQIEVNKTLMRRLLTVKNTAYPTKVANVAKIQNPEAIDRVGGIIKTKNGSVEDVTKILATIPPSQMSADVEKAQNDLISITRELAGAGDIANGDVNPESASGRAILAVQQASKEPLTEQMTALKKFVEDLSRIWLDMFITYSDRGLQLENEVADPVTGEKYINVVTIPQNVLEEIKATVKIDVTPKGAFDKYAQELSLENLLKEGYFNIQRLSELKVYVNSLDDDATMPKAKLEVIIEDMEQEQQKIAQINAEAQMMTQRANQFLNSDSDIQADQIRQAQTINQVQEEKDLGEYEN